MPGAVIGDNEVEEEEEVGAEVPRRDADTGVDVERKGGSRIAAFAVFLPLLLAPSPFVG